MYTSKVESFTHGKVYDIIVSKEFLHPEDRVLLIDDFLANGSALQGPVSYTHLDVYKRQGLQTTIISCFSN